MCVHHLDLYRGIAGLLHGDMAQGDRDNVITAFKKKEFPILIATDVAGNAILLVSFHHVALSSERARYYSHQDSSEL